MREFKLLIDGNLVSGAAGWMSSIPQRRKCSRRPRAPIVRSLTRRSRPRGSVPRLVGQAGSRTWCAFG